MDYKGLSNILNTELLNYTNIDQFLTQDQIDDITKKIQKSNSNGPFLTFDQYLKVSFDKQQNAFCEYYFGHNNEIYKITSSSDSIKIINCDRAISYGHSSEELFLSKSNGFSIRGESFSIDPEYFENYPSALAYIENCNQSQPVQMQ